MLSLTTVLNLRNNTREMSALAILLSSDRTHIQSFSIAEDGNGTVGGTVGECGSGGSQRHYPKVTRSHFVERSQGPISSVARPPLPCSPMLPPTVPLPSSLEGVLVRMVMALLEGELVRMVMALLEGVFLSMVVMVFGRSIAEDGSGPVASFQDPSSFHHLQYRKVETGYITNKANCSPTLAGPVAAYLGS